MLPWWLNVTDVTGGNVFPIQFGRTLRFENRASTGKKNLLDCVHQELNGCLSTDNIVAIMYKTFFFANGVFFYPCQLNIN